MDNEELKEKIKEIIYGNSRTGAICEDFEDGQIIGLKTGKGLELDNAAEGLSQFFLSHRTNDAEKLIEGVEGIDDAVIELGTDIEYISLSDVKKLIKTHYGIK